MAHTETSVLAHHGAPSTPNPADGARDAGILRICLGCGTAVAAPAGLTTEDYREAYPVVGAQVNGDQWDCCPDADSITY